MNAPNVQELMECKASEQPVPRRQSHEVQLLISNWWAVSEAQKQEVIHFLQLRNAN